MGTLRRMTMFASLVAGCVAAPACGQDGHVCTSHSAKSFDVLLPSAQRASAMIQGSGRLASEKGVGIEQRLNLQSKPIGDNKDTLEHRLKRVSQHTPSFQLELVESRVVQDLQTIMFNMQNKMNSELVQVVSTLGFRLLRKFIRHDFRHHCINACRKGPSGFQTTAKLCTSACARVYHEWKEKSMRIAGGTLINVTKKDRNGMKTEERICEACPSISALCLSCKSGLPLPQFCIKYSGHHVEGCSSALLEVIGGQEESNITSERYQNDLEFMKSHAPVDAEFALLDVHKSTPVGGECVETGCCEACMDCISMYTDNILISVGMCAYYAAAECDVNESAFVQGGEAAQQERNRLNDAATACCGSTCCDNGPADAPTDAFVCPAPAPPQHTEGHAPAPPPPPPEPTETPTPQPTHTGCEEFLLNAHTHNDKIIPFRCESLACQFHSEPPPENGGYIDFQALENVKAFINASNATCGPVGSNPTGEYYVTHWVQYNNTDHEGHYLSLSKESSLDGVGVSCRNLCCAILLPGCEEWIVEGASALLQSAEQ